MNNDHKPFDLPGFSIFSTEISDRLSTPDKNPCQVFSCRDAIHCFTVARKASGIWTWRTGSGRFESSITRFIHHTGWNYLKTQDNSDDFDQNSFLQAFSGLKWSPQNKTRNGTEGDKWLTNMNFLSMYWNRALRLESRSIHLNAIFLHMPKTCSHTHTHTHQPTIHQCSHSDCNPKILQSPTLSLTAWLRLWATTPMSLVLSIALSTFCRVILLPKWGLLMALTANDFVANIGKPRPPIITWRWYARASCFTHFSIHWALTVSPISKILDNPVVVRAWSSKTRTEANWTQ